MGKLRKRFRESAVVLRLCQQRAGHLEQLLRQLVAVSHATQFGTTAAVIAHKDAACVTVWKGAVPARTVAY